MDRTCDFVGLHPVDQRGRDRSLQPGEDGCGCGGAGTEARSLACRIGRQPIDTLSWSSPLASRYARAPTVTTCRGSVLPGGRDPLLTRDLPPLALANTPSRLGLGALCPRKRRS